MFWQTATAGDQLVLTVACGVKPDEIRLTVQNNGDDDTALLLGHALGNGRWYVPRNLVMELTRPATNESETLQHLPAFYRGGIAGRIDHWIMPSPARSSFTLAMSATDFTGRLRIQPTDRFVVRFNGQPITADLNVDMKGQRQWRFWAGTLESNPLRLADCRQ